MTRPKNVKGNAKENEKKDEGEVVRAAEERSRFRNRIYQAEVRRTEAGSPVIRILPLNPKGPSASHRQVAAFIYDLASEMETRSEALRATWAISPEAWNSRIILELGSTNEATAAEEFVRTLLADRNLD
jgi:hypothetical protein